MPKFRLTSFWHSGSDKHILNGESVLYGLLCPPENQDSDDRACYQDHQQLAGAEFFHPIILCPVRRLYAASGLQVQHIFP